MEEVGCEIEIEKSLGITIEYRNSHDLLHISYAYVCKVKGEIGVPKYEEGEIDDGYKSLWVSIDKALELLDGHFPKEPYEARFIVTREKTFIEEYKILCG